MPANFKSVEAQARLLAAVIAAHPELKLNYKTIAQHYGSDATASALEHRLRPLKRQARLRRALVKDDKDPKDVDELSEADIAKYFGESTPDGIQFQFRGIKKDAEALKHAADNNQSPVEAFGRKSGTVPSTPKKAGKNAASTPATKGSATNGSGGPRSGTKRKVSKPQYKELSNDDTSLEADYDALDNKPPTPTPSANGTASANKKAKTAANSTVGPAMSGALPAPLTVPSTRVSPSFAPTPSDSEYSVHTPSYPQAAFPAGAATHCNPLAATGGYDDAYGIGNDGFGASAGQAGRFLDDLGYMTGAMGDDHGPYVDEGEI